MFRLSETSQPSAFNTSIVVFVHNKDHCRKPKSVSGSNLLGCMTVKISGNLGFGPFPSFRRAYEMSLASILPREEPEVLPPCGIPTRNNG